MPYHNHKVKMSSYMRFYHGFAGVVVGWHYICQVGQLLSSVAGTIQYFKTKAYTGLCGWHYI